MDMRAAVRSAEHRFKCINMKAIKDMPVAKVLDHKGTHKELVELTLCLGENIMFKYLDVLSLDRDFEKVNGRYKVKVHNSIKNSEFFRLIYTELVGKKTLVADMNNFGDVQVVLDMTKDEIRDNALKDMHVPMIMFKTPEKEINIIYGVPSARNNLSDRKVEMWARN